MCYNVNGDFMAFNVGDVVTGNVTGIEDYGIFVSFDDKSSGLVHISEVSDDFVKDINSYASINSSLTTKVIGIESENHYRLSLKAINSSNKKMPHKIAETSKGFSTLSSVLEDWINDAYSDISKKN